MSRRREAGYPRIAIVGAGICAIAVGVKLKKAGIDTFTIFEANTGLGGTWWINRYPGAAVDIHSFLYQYSFNNYPWKRTHGVQTELLEYLEDTARRFDLNRHMRFSTKVESVAWSDHEQLYRLVTESGEEADFEIVVAATGFLSDPNLPQWPGLNDFEGIVFHTARWDQTVDLTGKRVAVVGVGSTSVQVVPAIQPDVEHLYVFQREPGWILPKGQFDFDEAQLAKYSSEFRRKLVRWRMSLETEWNYLTGPVYIAGSKRNRRAESAARGYIDRTFATRPDLRAALTPNYPFSGKRRVLSDEFYPSLLEENVELVPRAVARITPSGIVDVEGTEYPVDVIVAATGFKAWNYLSNLEVYGKDGVEIQEQWKDGAYALAGMTVPNFPNLYITYGPNTNGAGQFSVNSLAEQQATWVVKDVRRMVRGGYSSIETRASHTERYNSWLQKRLKKTAWAQANNYMKSSTGKIVTQFQGGVTLFWGLSRVLRLVSTYGVKGSSRRSR